MHLSSNLLLAICSSYQASILCILQKDTWISISGRKAKATHADNILSTAHCIWIPCISRLHVGCSAGWRSVCFVCLVCKQVLAASTECVLRFIVIDKDPFALLFSNSFPSSFRKGSGSRATMSEALTLQQPLVFQPPHPCYGALKTQ